MNPGEDPGCGPSPHGDAPQPADEGDALGILPDSLQTRMQAGKQNVDMLNQIADMEHDTNMGHHQQHEGLTARLT